LAQTVLNHQFLRLFQRVITKQNDTAPHETMLVIDGSSGQNAINQAKAFNKAITLNGISGLKKSLSG
jgi:fused signal recognition particle receptor